MLRTCLLVGHRLMAAFFLLVLPSLQTQAADPVALRNLGSGKVSIETFSGLTLIVDATAKTASKPPSDAQPSSLPVLTFNQPYHHGLVRIANVEQPRWAKLSSVLQQGETIGVLTARSMASDQTNPGDAPESSAIVLNLGATQLWLVRQSSLERTADQAALVDQAALALTLAEKGSRTGVLAVISDQAAIAEKSESAEQNKRLSDAVARWADRVDAATVIWASSSKPPESLTGPLAETLVADLVSTAFDTTAIGSPGDGQRRLIVPGTEPWKPAEPLASLFAAMEKSCADSQAVFAKLSVGQLNFRPSDGTHTPRWNCEHISGRQLWFFSQIFNAIDPVIPIMNVNPNQMPADYQAAHPQWEGGEEARHMQRVSQFCRRYGYLLDDLDVEKRAPGSRWPSLRALLVQMDRHYKEHTANTVQKFELDDWPKQ